MSCHLAPSLSPVTGFAFFLGGLLLVGFVTAPNGFAQGSKRLLADDSVQERFQEKDKNKEHPAQRDLWMMRGRSAARGQSAAALRLRAYREKLAMRVAAQRRSLAGAEPQTSTPWVALGPAPLTSDQDTLWGGRGPRYGGGDRSFGSDRQHRLRRRSFRRSLEVDEWREFSGHRGDMDRADRSAGFAGQWGGFRKAGWRGGFGGDGRAQQCDR